MINVAIADVAVMKLSALDASVSQVQLPAPTSIISGDIRVVTVIQGRIIVRGGS